MSRPLEDQKRRQIEYHEREHYGVGEVRAADNLHPYVEWLNHYRLRKAISMMRVSLSGKTVLTVCGGDGEEADYLHRCGAVVTTVDLSAVAARASRHRNEALRSACMDAESLGFADRSFDWVVVRDGLHHLARPILGLYEMARVAREGFVVIEAQDSLPVRWLAKLGVAENWDPAGGYVYRLSRREIYKIFSSMQTVKQWEIHSAWLPFGSDVLGLFPAFRRLVYPIMRHELIFKALDTRVTKSVFKAGFDLVNSLTGRSGNSFIVVARMKLPS